MYQFAGQLKIQSHQIIYHRRMILEWNHLLYFEKIQIILDAFYNVNEVHKLIYTRENYWKTYKKYTITPIKTSRLIIILGNTMFSAFKVTEWNNQPE